MKLVLLLMTFISYSAFSQAPDYSKVEWVCEELEASDPPFYVSDEYRQGDKIWENLRNIDNSRVADTYIPRGSIVEVDEQLFQYGEGVPDYRVPIRVLSLPSEEEEQKVRDAKWRKRDSIAQMARVGKKKRAEVDSIGWLDHRALKQAKNFVFFVKEDAEVHADSGVPYVGPTYLEFKLKNGKYLVNRCCTPDSFGGEEKCFDKHLMNVIDSSGDVLTEKYINHQECSFLTDSRPIRNTEIDSVRNILNMVRKESPDKAIDELEMLPPLQAWRGSRSTITRKEMTKIPVDEETQEGPFGSFHYKPDDAVSSDAYLKPTSMCAFMRVMEKWKTLCGEPGCQIQFGDLYHHDNWGAHSGHDSGECVDIRPMRKDDDLDVGLTYKQTRRYDREKTRDFVKLIKKSGARITIFNDRRIPGVRNDGGSVHNDHLHVCFGENRPKVQESCKDGL